MAKHPESTRMVQALAPGQSSIDDTVILAVGPVVPDEEGTYANRIALRVQADKGYEPFMVHMAIYDDERHRWVFTVGDYAGTIEKGLELFRLRAYGRED